MSDPKIDFMNCMNEMGFPVEDVIADGKLHRFHVEGDGKGSRNGAYIFHDDGLPNGLFGTFKDSGNGLAHKWTGKPEKELTPEERAKCDRQWEEDRKRAKEEEARKHDEAAKLAVEIWEAGDMDPERASNHPYTSAKGIQAHGARISTTEGSYRSWLMVDYRNEAGEIRTLQFIPDPAGGESKRFFKDGQKKGNFHTIEGRKPEVVLVCEGFATGASLNEATGFTVIVAGDAGNMAPVAKALRDSPAYSGKRFCVGGDTDASETGQKAAKEAAAILGCPVALPQFTPTQIAEYGAKHGTRDKDGKPKAKAPSDFNDLAELAGLQEVERQIEAATAGEAGSEAKPGAADEGPLPLRRPVAPQKPYPVEAFGEFAQTVTDVARYTNTSLSLVGSTMLAALSLMSQPLANVKTAKYRTPLSLFMLTVGETGDGKSTVESILFKPIREKEKELQREYGDKLAEYEAAQKTYDREVKRLDGQKGLSREEYQEQLTALEATKPMAPVEPFLFTGDANIEGLYRNLRYGLPYIGLFVGDGGRFLGGTAFTKENVVKTISNLSELWSGNALDKMRCGEGASKLHDRRVCSSIMIQPVLAQEMLTDALLTGQGFLCRHLFSWPVALPKTPEQIEIEQLPSVQSFYRACERLLQIPIRTDEKSGGLLFDDLTPSPEALETYKTFFRFIEANRQTDGKYEPVNGYAKRAAEQALRIAGGLSMGWNPAFRVMDGETMAAGVTLSGWYLDEILRITLDDMTSPEILKAEQLLKWLKDKGIKVTSIRQVVYSGPNAIREKEKAESVFSILEAHGWLEPIAGGAMVQMGKRQQYSRKAWKVADKPPMPEDFDNTPLATLATSATFATESGSFASIPVATPATFATFATGNKTEEVARVATVATGIKGKYADTGTSEEEDDPNEVLA